MYIAVAVRKVVKQLGCLGKVLGNLMLVVSQLFLRFFQFVFGLFPLLLFGVECAAQE